jgi:hypothetical protein
MDNTLQARLLRIIEQDLPGWESQGQAKTRTETKMETGC